MGGRIGVDSIEGAGSEFFFTLAATASESNGIIEDEPLPELQGQHLLIASRNETRCNRLYQLFTKWGLKADFVTSSRDTLVALQKNNHYHAIILDHHLPNLDAVSLGKAIQNMDYTQPLFIVSNREGLPKNLPITPAGILEKPIKQERLLELLHSTLNWKNTPLPVSDFLVFDPQLGQANPLSILIAEDDAINQELARLFFQRLGYEPDIVSNGLEVLEQLQKKWYDVIFMDVYMPEMDGLMTTRKIIQGFEGHERPVIVAMTASVTQHDRLQCELAGMDKFISKPIHLEHLVQVLRQLAPGDKNEALV